MRIIFVVVMASVLCVLVSSKPVFAQGSDDELAATKLFTEGRELMEQGRCDAAIAKFQASLELIRASGTLGSMALCYERSGKLASAWRYYEQAAVAAEQTNNARRAEQARARAAALEPRVPYLTIEVAKQVASLRVLRDDAEISTELISTPVPVDPGSHKIDVLAPGYQPYTVTVDLSEGQRRTLEIPELTPLSGLEGQTVTVPVPDQASPAGGDSGRARRVGGLVTGSAGLAAIGVGLAVGASAFSAWDDPFESGECERETLRCSPTGRDQVDNARTRARTSDILVGAGVAAAVVGAWLYFTAPDA